MGRRDAALLHLTRHAFLNQMAQAKAYFGNFGRGHGRGHLLVIKMWEYCRGRASQRYWQDLSGVLRVVDDDIIA